MKSIFFALVALFSLSAYGVTVSPINQPYQTFVDANGSPCSGCKLYTYVAGTTTPHPTYTDSTGTVQNTNPIILNVTGSASIWVDGTAYKLSLHDALDTPIWTVDNVLLNLSNIPAIFASQSAANPSAGTFTTIYANNIAGTISDGWFQDHGQSFGQACASALAAGLTLQITRFWPSVATGTYTCNREWKAGGIIQPANTTVYLLGSDIGTLSKHFDYSLGSSSHVIGPQSGPYSALKANGIPVEWYGAKCDFNGSSGTDDTTSIQNAVSDAKHVLISTVCSLTGTITVPDHTIIEGVYSRYTSRLRWTGTQPLQGISTLFHNDVTIKNLEIDGGADSGVTTGSIGVYMAGGSHYYMYDSGIVNWDYPLKVGDSAVDKSSINLKFVNLEVGGQHGINVPFANDIIFDHLQCPAAVTADYCLTVGTNAGFGVTAMSINGADIEPYLGGTLPSASGGIIVYNVSGLTISGIYAEADANANPFFIVDPSSTIHEGITLRGSYINNSASTSAAYSVRIGSAGGSFVSEGNQYLSLAAGGSGIYNPGGGNVVTVGDVAWTGGRAARLPVVLPAASVELDDLKNGSGLTLPNNQGIGQRVSGGGWRWLINRDASNVVNIGDVSDPSATINLYGNTINSTGGALALASSVKLTTVTPTPGHAACIKSSGPPVVIGYCSSVVASDGTCTCN